MSNELTQALQSLFVVALVAALAPVIVGLVPRLRVPQVVVLIVGGVIVGPQVLNLAEPQSIELPSNVDLTRVAETKRLFDPTGHYHRPDVFQLTVDTRPRHAVTLVREDAAAEPTPS